MVSIPIECESEAVSVQPGSDGLPTPAEVFDRARAAGHRGAQCTLAYIYQKGIGVEPDVERAFGLWLNAAKQGFDSAQYEVGIAYLEGLGVGRDPSAALTWLREAARQLHPEAEYRLGCLHRDGIGVGPDPVRANKWFLAANQHGYRCVGEEEPDDSGTGVR